MKTIFRYVNTGLLAAALLAVGAVAGFAQDPCEDAEGMTTLDAKFRGNWDKGIPQRKIAVEAGKQYIEKFGSCEIAKDFVDYLKSYLPGMEAKIATDEAAIAKEALYKRFNASVKASNFDETYAAGREILVKEPDQLDVMISLGSIGYDESYKGNFKFNTDTLRYAKQSIAAIEAGKTSSSYGLFAWGYNDKNEALGWLNYTIGYITQVAQKNKKDALPYLYKATQTKSTVTKNPVNKNPIPYELIGNYYFDELNKLTTEIQAMAATQSPTDTPEVAQQKVDAIKAKVALANGTSERAMDAFARAYTYGSAKEYKDKMYKNLQDAYQLRYAKTDGLDAWIAGAVKQNMPNPLTPVIPIGDPEPATTTSTTTTPGAAAVTGAKVSAPTRVGTVKPAPVAKKGVAKKVAPKKKG